jgi:hypothetical protein
MLELILLFFIVPVLKGNSAVNILLKDNTVASDDEIAWVKYVPFFTISSKFGVTQVL